jgi:hypothetical protein
MFGHGGAECGVARIATGDGLRAQGRFLRKKI